MTTDVAGQCSSLTLNSEQQLVEGDVIANNISTLESVSRLREVLGNSIYINSNMVSQMDNSKQPNSAIYTASLPVEFAGSFPEGTVLQLIPDSALLTVTSMKNPNAEPENNTLLFKDSSFSVEMGSNGNNLIDQNVLTMQNIETDLTEQQVTQAPEITVNAEDHISDIDLSFLTETDDSAAISDVRNINENSVSELQQSFSDSLQILQNNFELMPEAAKNEETVKDTSESSKDVENSDSNVVMIDVTNPIQLSQNSLIVVNGQKCILQHDTQTGLVVAYPVKEPDKPKRRRGRPRKTSRISQEVTSKEFESPERCPPETESGSETEIEKGLLEIVNDEGALVRRSSRKRKTTKVLRDYEVGNLKQELGSDAEEVDITEKDGDLKKKKNKGPGRPRKYQTSETSMTDKDKDNCAVKRRRGRPRKYVAESEPTQAFLVQTADGKNLMMHMPLSSIPPGVTLQEVAQDIANKLNIGLNQAESRMNAENTAQANESILEQEIETMEPAVQDHSIGSTTMVTCDGQQLELRNGISTESIIDSTSQEVMISSSDVSGLDSSTAVANDESNGIDVPESICEESTSFVDVQNVPESFFKEDVPTTVSITDSIAPQELILNSQSEVSVNHEPLNEESKEASFIEEHLGSLSSQESFSFVECNNLGVPREFLFDNDLLKRKGTISLLISPSKLSHSNNTSIIYVEKTSEPLVPNSIENNTESDFDALKFAIISNNYVQAENINLQTLDAKLNDIDQHIEALEKEGKASLEDNNILCVQNIGNEVKNDHLYGFESPSKKKQIASVYSSKRAVSLLNSSTVAQTIRLGPEIVENVNAKRKRGRPKKKVPISESVFKKPNQKMMSILIPPSSSTVNTSTNTVTNTSSGTTTSTSSSTTTNTSSPPVFSVPDKGFPMILPKHEPTAETYVCKVCQFPLASKEDLILHCKENHPRCICNICNYMSEHPYTMKRHSFRHNSSSCFCHICKKVYKDHYILKMHMKMVHMPADILFCCDVCDKKFTRKAHLKRHLRTHNPEKAFKCCLCDYRGCEKSDITKHMVIHEEPKHQCEICNKTFRHIKNKELHIKRHKGQRDYKCGICDFYGYTFTDIRKHIERKHNNSKHILCDVCGQACKTAELLKEHKMSSQCQNNALQQELNNTEQQDDCIHLRLVEDMPIDILEEQDQGSISYDTTTLSQNSRLVIDGILSTQNGEIVVNELDENCILSSENFSLVTTDGDAGKEMTLISTNEEKDSKQSAASFMANLPLETPLSIDEGAAPDMFSLCSMETEVCATQDIDSTTS